MVAQRAADCRERNSGVSAGRLCDRVAGIDAVLLVGFLQNVKGHAVFDAAGQVEMFGLCIDHPLFPAIQKTNREQRRVADHVLELFTAIRDDDRRRRTGFTIE